MVDRIVREHGRMDILINNAGVNTIRHRVPIDQFPRDEWERIVQIDLTGLYLVSRIVADAMRSQNWGRIVNIASVAGLVRCGSSVRSSPPRPGSSISPRPWLSNWDARESPSTPWLRGRS